MFFVVYFLLPALLRSLFSTFRRMEQSYQCVFTPLWSQYSTMKPFRWRICAKPWRTVWLKLLSLQNIWMRKLFITFSLVDVLLLEGLRFAFTLMLLSACHPQCLCTLTEMLSQPCTTTLKLWEASRLVEVLTVAIRGRGTQGFVCCIPK